MLILDNEFAWRIFMMAVPFVRLNILSVNFDSIRYSSQFDPKFPDICRLRSKANTKNQYPLKSKQITNIKILRSGYPL